jgi:hypothetical protein
LIKYLDYSDTKQKKLTVHNEENAPFLEGPFTEMEKFTGKFYNKKA